MRKILSPCVRMFFLMSFCGIISTSHAFAQSSCTFIRSYPSIKTYDYRGTWIPGTWKWRGPRRGSMWVPGHWKKYKQNSIRCTYQFSDQRIQSYSFCQEMVWVPEYWILVKHKGYVLILGHWEKM